MLSARHQSISLAQMVGAMAIDEARREAMPGFAARRSHPFTRSYQASIDYTWSSREVGRHHRLSPLQPAPGNA